MFNLKSISTNYLPRQQWLQRQQSKSSLSLTHYQSLSGFTGLVAFDLFNLF